MDIKTIGHSAFCYGTRYLGINSAARWFMRSKLLVLCYHSVIDDDHKENTFRYRNCVTVRDFEKQLKILQQFFNPISAHHLIQHIEGKTDLPARAVLVTFDDGFRNNLLNAAPVLEKYGIPAVFHVTTAYIGTQRILWTQQIVEFLLNWPNAVFPLPHKLQQRPIPSDLRELISFVNKIRSLCKQIPDRERQNYLTRLGKEVPTPDATSRCELYSFMTWKEVVSLHKKGFAIGSHTVNHPILTRLTPNQLEYELNESKARIENELGEKCCFIAYPNGGYSDFSKDVILAAKKAGYKVGFTITEKFNGQHLKPLVMSRIPIGRIPTCAFHNRISGPHSMLKNVLP